MIDGALANDIAAGYVACLLAEWAVADPCYGN